MSSLFSHCSLFHLCHLSPSPSPPYCSKLSGDRTLQIGIEKMQLAPPWNDDGARWRFLFLWKTAMVFVPMRADQLVVTF
ncbi:hypothetical protein L484_020824 [Morus notabilis]|uniref:Uncharacterized protein n=1 Tax=Morus notabilis TaxID=981085 RepID=W9R2J8_9ROSA|nr:hypothetical protein L484_020824 [Morus notabilis]